MVFSAKKVPRELANSRPSCDAASCLRRWWNAAHHYCLFGITVPAASTAKSAVYAVLPAENSGRQNLRKTNGRRAAHRASAAQRRRSSLCYFAVHKVWHSLSQAGPPVKGANLNANLEIAERFALNNRAAIAVSRWLCRAHRDVSSILRTVRSLKESRGIARRMSSSNKGTVTCSNLIDLVCSGDKIGTVPVDGRLGTDTGAAGR